MIGGIVPKEAIARCNRVNACAAMINCKKEGICAGAADGVGVVVGVGTRGSIFRLVPYVAIAGGDGVGIVCGGIERKVECYGAVAAVGIEG